MSQGRPVPESLPPVPEAGPEPGPLGVLLNLVMEPRAAFAAILKRPGRFWIPLVAAVALHVIFTAVWVQRMDPPTFMRNELEQSGRADKMSPEQIALAVERGTRVIKPISVVSAVIAPPLVAVIFGLVLWFVYRFFYGGEVTFLQSLAIVSWSSLAIAAVSIPLLLAVFFSKGDWNLNPQNALQANLSLLLDRETTSRVLWSLAESIDLFVGWFVFLLASGFGLAIRKPTAAALWGVVIPWALLVAMRLGWVAITG